MSDETLSRRLIVAAALCGLFGVALGAFGAHGLDRLLSARGYEAELVAKRLDQFNTGVRYQLVHAAALLALAGISIGDTNTRRWVGRLLIAGVVLFSGSLYALVVSNNTKFGMVAPIGGLAWIVGWLMLAMLARPKIAKSP